MCPERGNTNELLKSQWVIMAILHLSYFLEFNCWSFWKATCNRRVSRTEQFQCTPTRRNLSTTSKNKCTALSGHHFSALGKSSRRELQSSPKSHIQSEIKMLWCFSHFRPGHQPPHQLLSATSQRCASMRALQLTHWRWTRELRTVLRLLQVPHLSLAFTLWKAAILSHHHSCSDHLPRLQPRGQC